MRSFDAVLFGRNCMFLARCEEQKAISSRQKVAIKKQLVVRMRIACDIVNHQLLISNF